MTKEEREKMIATSAAYRAEIESSLGYAEVECQVRAEYAIAKAIAKAKEASKMTQGEIAQKMGTTQSVVSRILRAKNLSVNSLVRYFDACGYEMVITAKKKQA